MNPAKFDKYMNDLLAKTFNSMKESVNKLEHSGAIDIENAEDNYRLPKNIMAAICLHMADEWKPLNSNKKELNEIKNIHRFL